MELYFLDENFSLIEVLDDFSSVVWSEKFYSVGSFTIHFPREYVAQVKDAVYVRTSYSNGEAKCGRIERISVRDGGDCTIGGKMLEALIGDRIIEGCGSSDGRLTDAVIAVVEENLRGCGVEIAADQPLLADEVSLAYSYDNLADWLYSVLKPYGASFSVTLDADADKPVFRLVKGIDRSSDSSSSEQAAVFSSSFGNIVSLDFERNESGTKNAVYVEGADKTVVLVDRSGIGKRREFHSLEKTITPDDYDSTEAYKAALYQRGLELLAEYTGGMRVSAECDADALPLYGRDYSLGDLCDVCDNDVGLSFALRITEVDTVSENGRTTVFPSFGDEIRSIKKLYRSGT